MWYCFSLFPSSSKFLAVQQFVAARCLAASSIVVKQISLPSGSTLFATQIFILLVCSHGAVAASCSPARLRKPSQIQKIKQKKQKKKLLQKRDKSAELTKLRAVEVAVGFWTGARPARKIEQRPKSCFAPEWTHELWLRRARFWSGDILVLWTRDYRP